MARLRTLEAAAALVFIFLSPSYASERIISFDSRVEIYPDAALVVTETITVDAGNEEIRHGIYRDFPTEYTRRDGSAYVTGFDVLDAELDGRPVKYHSKDMDNGVRVYMGDKDELVSIGVHKYVLRYRTDRQISSLADYDELFWNVNGNGWNFRIDKITSTFVLPEGAKVLKHQGYTGYMGQRGGDYAVSTDSHGNPVFSTTRGFLPNEGLSVAIAWPKGFVGHEPAFWKKGLYFLRDHRDYLVATGLGGLLLSYFIYMALRRGGNGRAGFLIAILVVGGLYFLVYDSSVRLGHLAINGYVLAAVAFGALFVYYIDAWMRVGRDPKQGVIVPLFHPPEGLCPAAVYWLRNMAYDDKALTVTVINLAVRKILGISVKDRKYTLIRTEKATGGAGLSSLESSVLAKLLPGIGDKLELGSESHEKVWQAREALRKSLESTYGPRYFSQNEEYGIRGMALGLGIYILMFFVFEIKLDDLESAILVSIGGFVGTLLLLLYVASGISGAWRFSPRGAIELLAGTAMLVAAFMYNPEMALSASILMAMVMIFGKLLKAPTVEGRKAMDGIEGFRMYLSATEKDRLNMLNAPERTPAHFEECLPYALALGVEQRWSEQFAGVIAAAADVRADMGDDPSIYTWYSDSSGTREFGSSFASSLGDSLSGAISSAASAPSDNSESSFSGGGSSGGGGGGGGGGGW